MTLSTDLIPLTKHVVLDGVTWEEYERVLERIGNRSIRVTFDGGRMEIMSPLPQHEGEAEAIGALAREAAIEAGISIRGFGSTTYRREDRKGGLEPDRCYYLKNEPKVRGMKRFDPKAFPPPDLAIEMDVTSRSVPREPIYARLGVPEIWRSRQGRISVRVLGEGGVYRDAANSDVFPFLPMAQFERFVQRMLVEEPNAIVREFREWVRDLVRRTSAPVRLPPSAPQ